jgi:3',5'-cyclic AMP phosphodiesterase CpdA
MLARTAVSRRLVAFLGLAFVSTVLALVRPGTAQEADRLRFVQITDTHVGGEGWRERLQRVVAEIAAFPRPLEFVALTGDITENSILDDALLEDAKAVLAALQVPLYVLPGNHDILADRVDETVAAYRRRFGDLGQVHEHRGVRFVFLAETSLWRPLTIPGFDPWVKLEELLRDASGKSTIVFTHAPISEGTYAEDARVRWARLLGEHGVKAVISGHIHTDALLWIGAVPNYVAANIAGMGNRPPSFRVYEYVDGRLSYVTRYVR